MLLCLNLDLAKRTLYFTPIVYCGDFIGAVFRYAVTDGNDGQDYQSSDKGAKNGGRPFGQFDTSKRQGSEEKGSSTEVETDPNKDRAEAVIQQVTEVVL